MTAARTRAVSVVAEALADQLGVTGISEVWRDVAEAVVAALEAEIGLRVERQAVRLPQFEGDVRPGPRPHRLATAWQEDER